MNSMPILGAAEALKLVEKAALHVKVYHPFFGALLEKLKLKVDPRHETMYTDAVVIGFNPLFVVKLEWNELVFIMAHEVAHCALRHPFRRGKRDPKLWGEAIDHAANLFLLDDPSLAAMWPRKNTVGLADKRFAGMAAEQIYATLLSERAPQPSDEQSEESKPSDGLSGSTGGAGDCLDAGASGERPDEDFDNDDEEKSDGKADKQSKQDKAERSQEPAEQDGGEGEESAPDADGDGEDEGDGEGAGADGERDSDAGSGDGEDDDEDEDGDLDDAPHAGEHQRGDQPLDPSEVAQLDREWGEATMTAALAQGGEMGEGQGRALGAAGVVRKSFDEYVDEFAERCVAEDQSWKRPNKRFSDVYLPSKSVPVIQKMVAGIDTSGSISDSDLRLFEQALERIQESFNVGEMIVACCDTKIRKVERFQRGESITLTPEGGGGTKFEPVFKLAKELMSEGEDIAGVIYLTDMMGHVDGWRNYEDIETLWVSTTPTDKLYYEVNFGRICSIHS